MKARKQIDKYGTKAIRLMIFKAMNGDAGSQRWLADRHLEGSRVKLSGDTAEELIDSLIAQAHKPNISSKSIADAINIIKLKMDAIELKKVQKRIKKLEEGTK